MRTLLAGETKPPAERAVADGACRKCRTVQTANPGVAVGRCRHPSTGPRLGSGRCALLQPLTAFHHDASQAKDRFRNWPIADADAPIEPLLHDGQLVARSLAPGNRRPGLRKVVGRDRRPLRINVQSKDATGCVGDKRLCQSHGSAERVDVLEVNLYAVSRLNRCRPYLEARNNVWTQFRPSVRNALPGNVPADQNACNDAHGPNWLPTGKGRCQRNNVWRQNAAPLRNSDRRPNGDVVPPDFAPTRFLPPVLLGSHLLARGGESLRRSGRLGLEVDQCPPSHERSDDSSDGGEGLKNRLRNIDDVPDWLLL